MLSTPKPLSNLTIRLHWLVAIVMISIFCAGQLISNIEMLSFLYPIHKSMGMLALLLILPRVLWRIFEGWPTPAAESSAIQERMSKAVHWTLILATIAMPLSGMLMSGASGYGLYIFGYELLATNPDPSAPSKMLPLNTTLAEVGQAGHIIWSKILLVVVILHVAGALKHHFISKNATLTRMLGR